MPDFVIAHHKDVKPLHINRVIAPTQPKAILKLLDMVYHIKDPTMDTWLTTDLLRWARQQNIFISKPTQAHCIAIPQRKLTH